MKNSIIYFKSLTVSELVGGGGGSVAEGGGTGGGLLVLRKPQN